MTLEELEKRIIFLEDMEKIKMLHREYLFYISNVEMDKALECFSENIVTDIAQYGEKKGKTEVTKFFKEVIYNNVFTSKEAHYTGQPVIKIEGNKATGHWMFYRFLTEQSAKRWIQGRYDCEYIKENGEWKFSFMRMTRPWPEFFK